MQEKSLKPIDKIMFEALGDVSPELKSIDPYEEIQQLNLEQNKNLKQKSKRKNRRNKLKTKQTNLIRIKPIQNEIQFEEEKQFKLKQTSEKLDELQNQSNQFTKNKNPALKLNEAVQTMQSPVLYRISDQENEYDEHPYSQQIPQSSRRPLNKSIKNDKKDAQDQLQSEAKVFSSSLRQRRKVNKNLQIKKKRDVYSKPNNFLKNNKKMQIQQNHSPTQVYEYNQNQNQSQSQSYEDQQGSQYQNQQEQAQQQFQRFSHSNNKSISLNNTPQKQKQSLIFKSTSFYTLINSQVPVNNYINCLIRRRRGQQFFEKIVTYECFLIEDQKYLMTCIKNRMLKTTSHFQFYRERNQKHKYSKDNLYAYLNSNFTGTQFILKTLLKHDTNSQRSTTIDKNDLLKMEDSTTQVVSEKNYKSSKMFPNQTKQIQTSKNDVQNQKQACFISFKANFFGLAGQRQVKLLKKKNKKLHKSEQFSDLKYAQQNGQIDKFYEFHNKKASIGKNGLELDFKGVAKIQSTKNIVVQDQKGKQVLIFGKVKQDIYSVSISNPLNIIEGLAFGIANLDRKFFVN